MDIHSHITTDKFGRDLTHLRINETSVIEVIGFYFSKPVNIAAIALICLTTLLNLLLLLVLTRVRSKYITNENYFRYMRSLATADILSGVTYLAMKILSLTLFSRDFLLDETQIHLKSEAYYCLQVYIVFFSSNVYIKC